MKLIYISAAMSLDGHIDDQAKERLILSSDADFQSVQEARSNCDAILVGANTIRRDNPSLVFRNQQLIAKRLERGQKAELIKVTVTAMGNLDLNYKFFAGDSPKYVICPMSVEATLTKKFSKVATVLAISIIDAANIINALEKEGVNSLFVEGGSSILTMFLSQGKFHRLRLAIAPFFVGDSKAPSIVNNAQFIHTSNNRLRINSVQNLDNTAVLDISNEGYGNG